VLRLKPSRPSSLYGDIAATEKVPYSRTTWKSRLTKRGAGQKFSGGRRDLGYGETRESRSMFNEGLATSERILGATNAPRPVSPMRAYSDVSSAHAVEAR